MTLTYITLNKSKENENCIHCSLTISFGCNSNYPSKRLSIRSTFPSLQCGVHRIINNHHSLIAATVQILSQPQHHTSIGQASSQSQPTLHLLSSTLLHWLADIIAVLLLIVWLMREALHCRCNIQEYIVVFHLHLMYQIFSCQSPSEFHRPPATYQSCKSH